MQLISLDHRTPARFVIVAAAGAAIVLAYGAAVLLGAPPVVTQALYVLGTASAPVAIAIGIRINRPEAWLPWTLIAAGALLSAFGDFLYALYPELFGRFPDLQLINIPYLLRFPLIATGMVMLVRRRTPGWDRPAMIDAAIVAVSVSLASWVFVIDPTWQQLRGAPLHLVVEALAFPVGDLLLLVIGARMMLGGGADLPALRMIGLYLIGFCGGDTWYAVRLLHGDYAFWWPMEVAWAGASVLLGLAGVHPSMRPLGDRAATAGPVATTGRLVLLAAASLLAPLTLVVQYLRGADLHVLLVAGCCAALFLLVVGRLAGLVQAQRHAAITDSLTGLHTRRYFAESLGSECARAARAHEPLSLILLDVDHFKKVNDTYGHSAGDRVLVEVATRLRASIRSGDVVARYGGEEFAVLLPRTSTADAATVAERLRAEIMRSGVVLSATEVITVTVSSGVATAPQYAGTPDDLVNLADVLLYRSKESGRNRVTVVTEAWEATATLAPGTP
ncbi:GGDEF domain-containing protein [Actinoplanes sp. NPDC051851]|uniref:GGDEF domain-containing protein n=1 Tax=Actinoplanes sp. NPDC051851 TaxID=3154753 RepID=UPI0034359429